MNNSETLTPAEVQGNVEAAGLVRELADLRAKIGEVEGRIVSDGAFSRRFLGAFQISSGTWSKLQSGDYNGGRIFGKIDDMKAAIAAIKKRMPRIVAAAERKRGFYETALARAVDERLTIALDDPYGRRIVVALAPTGYGKTAIVNHLKAVGAVCVEGLQAWKSSYRSFCASIAKAAGKEVPRTANQERAEELMLDALSVSDRTVVIDEANTLSGSCANGIKEIVNRTGCTVVILAIPEFWDRFLAGNRGEVRQIINRCQRVIRQVKMKDSDVRLFLRLRNLPEGYAKPIADAANAFGGFRTVINIMDEIQDDPSLANLQRAVATHELNLRALNMGNNNK